MKLKIPDALKADMPQTMWGRILAATRAVMALVATLPAGVACGEMTRAQYDPSLAARQQSKAGDQWGHFQAKRLRGTGLRTARQGVDRTVGILRAHDQIVYGRVAPVGG